MIVALCLAAVFVTCRLATMEGDPSRFVVTGSLSVDPDAAPKSLHVEPGEGYDGQFFHRLALAPADLRLEAHGVRLDTPLRRQRLGYPVLAWLVSAGRPGLVVWTLLLVNILGMGVLGLLGGLAAQEAGRHALWGAHRAGVPRVRHDPRPRPHRDHRARFVLGGLLVLRRQRPLAAGLLLSAAVLTRESTMLVVAAVAVVDVVRRWRNFRRPQAADSDRAGVRWAAAAWTLPTLAFLAWKLALTAGTGSAPLGSYTSPVPLLLGDPRRRLGIPAAILAAGWLTTAAFRVPVV